jgi:chemotaxis protein MotB
MAKVKRKKLAPPPEEGCPIWMATYADLMSLLLCFFVMLFSMSIIAEVKWIALIETLERQMAYSGQSSKKSQSNRPASAMPAVSERARRAPDSSGGTPIPGRPEELPTAQTISVTGEVVKGGLIRFDLGSDDLNEQAKEGLEALFPVLRDSSNKIMIQGHVAPTETEGGIYKRDYYLAHGRAVNTMNYLIEKGLKKEFFQISMTDSTTIPHRAILPLELRGDPKLAGMSAAIYLIDKVSRPSNDDKEVPAP